MTATPGQAALRRALLDKVGELADCGEIETGDCTTCNGHVDDILAAVAAQEPHAAPEARTALAADVHELIDGYCPDIPMCPKCERRKGELLDLADDYAATGGPDSALADDNTSLRKERDGLRAHLQAVRRLMADAAANGVIDSRAILAQLDTAPAEAKPAPELRAAMAESRGYREALHRALEALDEDGTIGRRLSVARSIVKAALEGK